MAQASKKRILLTILILLPATALVLGLIALALHDPVTAGVAIGSGILWDIPVFILYKRAPGRSSITPEKMYSAETLMLALGLIAGAIYIFHK